MTAPRFTPEERDALKQAIKACYFMDGSLAKLRDVGGIGDCDERLQLSAAVVLETMLAEPERESAFTKEEVETVRYLCGLDDNFAGTDEGKAYAAEMRRIADKMEK